MYGTIAILPIYGQVLWGETSLQGGKLLLFFTLGTGFGGITSGKLTQKFSYARLALGGWSIVTMGFCLLAFTSKIDVSNPFLVLLNLISGFGLGITLALFLLPAQNAVAENRRSVAAGLVQLSRNLGGAIGIPFITGLLTAAGGLDRTTVTTGKFFVIFSALALLSTLGAIIGNRFKGSVIIDRENFNIWPF
jgi:DHA2 family multidrug resistance protein